MKQVLGCALHTVQVILCRRLCSLKKNAARMCVTALYQCMQQGTSNICIVPYSTPQQTCTQACAESMCNGHYQDKTWLAYGGDPPMIGYARKYCAMCIAVEPTGRCQPWNICTDLSMTCTTLHLPSVTLP